MAGKKKSDIKQLDKIVVRDPTTRFIKNVVFPNGITVGTTSSPNGMAIYGDVAIQGDLTIRGETATFGGTEVRTIVSGGGGANTEDTDGDTKIQVEESSDEDKIRFDTAGSERMIIDNSGNVGIGTSEPKTSLTVINDYATTTFENLLLEGEAGGDIMKYGTGTTVAGELYYLHTDGSWADAEGTRASLGGSQMLAVALGTSPTTHGMLLKGFVRIASTLINGTAQIGKPVYVSETAGEYDFTAPSSSAEFVRIVGYCIDTHTSDMLLYFNPDSTWVEIS